MPRALRRLSTRISVLHARRLCHTRRRQILAEAPSLFDTKEIEPLAVDIEPGKTCRLDLFAIHAEDGVHVFENWCPHAGGPLNLFPDTFIAPDRQHLICSRHAARFRFEDGVCVHGPCVGHALNEVPVEVGPDGITVSESALRELCLRSPSQLPPKLRRHRKQPA
eukprot:scaffold142161_cov26-Tisochrysis_lutea.AAC.1